MQIILALFFLGIPVAKSDPSPLPSSAGSAPQSSSRSSPQFALQWSAQMQSLKSTLQELLLDVSSDKRYQDEKNRPRIEANAKKMADLAHDLDSRRAPDQDPTLLMISALFSRESKHAYVTYKNGYRPYARLVLRGLTSYCIACHTRNATGPSFLNPSEEALKPLTAFEKAEFLVATRNFKSALDAFEAILASPRADNLLEWERSLRTALAIAVRVNQDPDLALRFVDRALHYEPAPAFLKEQAIQWKKSILVWKNELGRKPTSEDGLFAEATRLISLAKRLQKYPADHSADLTYLRATGLLHDLLGRYPDGRHVAEALYQAGLCYQALEGLQLWDLHEVYYLGCIHRAPHTGIAQSCYRRYEESVYNGYTGSGGTFLPIEVTNNLKELRLLAQPAVLVRP